MNLDFNAYVQLCKRTDKEHELSYYYLQLAREAGEVLETFIKSTYHNHEGDREKRKLELGDLLWFIAIISDKDNISLEEIFKTEINCEDIENDLSYYYLKLAEETGNMLSIFIKNKYYNVQKNIEDNKKQLKRILNFMLLIADNDNLSLEEIAETNIEKLSKRYPEGYSDYRSINREV